MYRFGEYAAFLANTPVFILIGLHEAHEVFSLLTWTSAMDGLALAHHISENWPEIALLITSARPQPDRAMLPEKSRFLAKPYHHSHVVRHIRELAAAA